MDAFMGADQPMTKTARPRVADGLIGSGIQASASPAMHMAEAGSQGFDLTYELLDLGQIDNGVSALNRLLARARGFAGVNITHPVKQAVIPLLDDLSEDVRALGAVNTMVFRDCRRTGHNTDWTGFAQNLKRGLPGAGDRRPVAGHGRAALSCGR